MTIYISFGYCLDTCCHSGSCSEEVVFLRLCFCFFSLSVSPVFLFRLSVLVGPTYGVLAGIMCGHMTCPFQITLPFIQGLDSRKMPMAVADQPKRLHV
ncbi:hypothetical protein BDV37DRAFT_145 [Aspergillus pseudonomiae]|uniref:Uncharacterized protein n=1 Tax=Aspergillus pseudonomiae TaxID=1506151 RepID=A0A5N7DTF9_9EURO|nr:uncharacterized protein BDV37DRAFT_145 [Aspergillus pseudonomiae]KAE8409751.1 hypothetical protein BDV37DRAFT_145 [Aspergillus pseudonomiae]